MFDWVQKLFYSEPEVYIIPEFTLGVSQATDNTITFHPNDWAPGIWAGSEKMKLNVNKKFDILILGVNFEARQLLYMSLSQFGEKVRKGDMLYLPEMRIVDGRD